MTKVSFIQSDGRTETFSARPGDTLLDVALDNGVAGIKGQCGGGCTCCTCHCWVRTPWLQQLAPPHQDELDMLVYAWGRADNSRLACQVPLSEALDGIEVEVPEQQS
jgi:2Fe-2S ferredoxin